MIVKDVPFWGNVYVLPSCFQDRNIVVITK